MRLYSFLAQVLTFLDADLEKIYVFARHLRRLISVEREELPREIQQNIDMESVPHPADRTAERSHWSAREAHSTPWRQRRRARATPEEVEALSRIIADLNERFGIELGPEHRVTLGRMLDRLGEDAALEVATKVNTLENVRIAFDYKVEQVIQEIVDLNFDLYKRITDDPAFGEVVKNHLFDQYLRAHGKAEEAEG